MYSTVTQKCLLNLALYVYITNDVKGTTLFAVVGLKRKINVKFLLASLKTPNSSK